MWQCFESLKFVQFLFWKTINEIFLSEVFANASYGPAGIVCFTACLVFVVSHLKCPVVTNIVKGGGNKKN